MKVLYKKDIQGPKEECRVITEKLITQSITSPYIIKLHYAFQSKTKLYFILDFMNGGDLFYHIVNKFRMKEKKVVHYASQILLGLKCLHDNDIVYRDLKPMNILLDKQGNVKLADFGLSRMDFTKNKEAKLSMWGTVQYIAPEVAMGVEYDKSVDWWSFGIIIYEMLSGNLPYDNKDKMIMMRDIVTKEPKMPRCLSKTAKDLITKLLRKDPKERLGSQGVEDIIRHPFFKSVDWEELLWKDNDNSLMTLPKGYKKFWYGKSPNSSVISEKTSEKDSRFGDFTYIEENQFRRHASIV